MPLNYETPLVNYDSIIVGEQPIELSSTHRVSFIYPYNTISIKMTPKNCSLSQYRVMITAASEEYDIDIGNLAYSASNIEYNKQHTFSITLNSMLCNKGNITYRISLYAQSQLDYSWDATYLFFTVGSDKFIPLSSSGFEVLTDRRL